MDDRRFDDLTRSLTSFARRRTVVGLLSSGALAGVLAALGGPEAGAGKPKNKKKPKPCPGGKTRCKGVCVNTKTSTAHCGGCGSKCGQGKSCVGGKCEGTTCTPRCDGKDCGDGDGCGGACTVQQGCVAGQSCVAGQCEATGCPSDYPAFCSFGSGTPSCHQCCDGSDCAANSLASAQGRTDCFFGNCVCPAGKPDLCRIYGNPPSGNRCTNVQTDVTNCGSCGLACCNPEDPTCKDWGCCSGQCVYLPKCGPNSGLSGCASNHCGACNTPCSGLTPYCCSGKCVVWNEENCGFCGAKCPDGQRCCGETCGTNCTPCPTCGG